MKHFFKLALCILFSSALVFGQALNNDANAQRTNSQARRASTPSAAPAPVAKIFRDDLGLLKDGTHAAILLPSELLASVADSEIKITSATSDASGYEITLATGEDCGDACFVGIFNATPDDGHATGGGDEGSHAVRLAHNLKGFYTPRSCGGSCTPPSISWLYGKHAYYIQFNVRGATPAQEEANMIRMANSAIEGGAR